MVTRSGGGATLRSARNLRSVAAVAVRKPHLTASRWSSGSPASSRPTRSPDGLSGTSVCLVSTVGSGYMSTRSGPMEPSWAAALARYWAS
jgi:hypothetical protein